MKKPWLLLTWVAVCTLALSACAGSADTMQTPVPSPSASVMPTQSAAPTQSASPTQSAQPAGTQTGEGITTLDDAVRVGSELATDLQKLSEVKDAVVVAAGNMALVGLTFDSQYQGGMTDRVAEMVKQRALAIDSGLTTVEATDDAALVEKISALAEQAEKKAITFSELQSQALALAMELEQQASPSVTNSSTGA